MKIKIDSRELMRKRRRMWVIKPFTRVIEDKKRYNRNRVKRLTIKEINEELRYQKQE
ncbi:MAG: hypothetical protein ONB05_04060 [candidate division KSB1 bacterium]|nr:hypothetical protein [candidate division KSB1 bacterium]